MIGNLRNWFSWFLMVLAIVSLVFFLAAQTTLLFQLLSGNQGTFPSLSDGNIAVVEINGGIFSVQEQLNRLKKFKERDSVKGLLLDVNSPGGLVGPSQELSNAIERFAEKKPVVASIRSLGASGAYYAASSADTIVVNPGGMVGSIGVIMEFVNVQDLIQKIGLDYKVIKSGKYKDIGSPFRKMSEDEREILRKLIMDVYDQFLDHILEHRRSLDRNELEKMADGRIFTGRQAKEKGLVDVTGGRHKAIQILKKAAGIEGEPQLIEPSKNQFSLSEMQSFIQDTIRNFIGGSRRRFRLLYMMNQWNGFTYE